MASARPALHVISNAAFKEAVRLIDLFPVSSIKAGWQDLEGTKEALCDSIATTRDADKIRDFMNEHFACCKQHVFFLKHNGATLTADAIEIPGCTLIHEVNAAGQRRLFYLMEIEFEVVTKELKLETLKLLAPVRLEIFKKHLFARFVIVNKNFNSLYPDGYYRAIRKGLDEKSLVDQLCKTYSRELELSRMDIHKGVKTLWTADNIDSPVAVVKQGKYKSTIDMDEAKGIKEYAPEVYKEIENAPVIKQYIVVRNFGQDFSIDHFTCLPGEWFLAFLAYSERIGDTDHVINEILRNN